jgi:hypothetical protein
MKLLLSFKNDIEKATASAINKAAKTALSRTEAFIMQTYNIKKKDLNEVVKMIKANPNKLIANVLVKEKGIGLYKFSPRQTQKGVTAAVKKGERKLYASDNKASFIQTMPRSGHKGVFVRTSKKKKFWQGYQTKKKGYVFRKYEKATIREFFGISTMQIFNSEITKEKLQEIFAERFKIELDRELNYRLSK